MSNRIAGKPEYFMGVDLGQRRDRTAIAILERTETIADRPDPITWSRPRIAAHQVRHLERLSLGTPYTVVTQRMDRIARKLAATGTCTLVIDATGVGLPVVDTMRIPAAPWRLLPVTIGSALVQSHSDGFWRVPKRDLIAGLQLGFDAGDFTIARALRDSEALVEELVSMRATTRLSGHTQLASPGAAHDDLAIALALAWWAAQSRRPGTLGEPNRLL